MASSFTHLHVHTEYSMLDGAARVTDLVAAAVQDGQPALGITDHAFTAVTSILKGQLQEGDEVVTRSMSAKATSPAGQGIRR